eukprot:21407-Heterococcus_DN1.PRE.5
MVDMTASLAAYAAHDTQYKMWAALILCMRMLRTVLELSSSSSSANSTHEGDASTVNHSSGCTVLLPVTPHQQYSY